MVRTPSRQRSAARRHGRGFTFVELLVVLLILAALMLIALPRYFSAVYRSRVRGCQAQIEITSTACQVFFSRNRVWPTTVEEMCEPTAPSWVVAPPLTEVPICPFGVPYEVIPILQDGSVGGVPTPDNPQVGVTLNTSDHFEGSWKKAFNHK
jgi:prepilin-type N-terminal cleavage/methylation domain-containing protein